MDYIYQFQREQRAARRASTAPVLDNVAPTPTPAPVEPEPQSLLNPDEPGTTLDNVQPEPTPEPKPDPVPVPPAVATFDAVALNTLIDDVVSTDIDVLAAAIVQEWAETLPEDLDAGEGMGDRLLALMVGAMPEGEFVDGIDDDAADDLADLGDAVGDVLADLGASDADLEILLNDFDNDVADAVQELAAGSLADGIDPVGFVLGDGSDEPALDAVYRKRIAVRQGKKVRINKRVSGKVVLTSGQKTAVRKMQIKSRTSMAKLRRAKSMRVRTRMGL
ncbi:hypothetical protein BJP27_24100 (plasmid) [Pseudomonas oryzihabitans]|nr:hypothetical protein BJP27_24100 [Pseudomonas psychrotolerans]